MKRILILLLALMPFKALGQNYKPLKQVDVPNTPATVVRVEETSYRYTSSHIFGHRSINAYMGVPFEYDIQINIKDVIIPKDITANFHIGGQVYNLTVFFSELNYVSMSLLGDHIKHIAVSGIQKIVFHKYGDVIHTQEFNAVEQELWRRTAEELISAIDKFKVL